MSRCMWRRRALGFALAVVGALGPVQVYAQRVVTTYYEWIGVETLPGFLEEFGDPDELAGISENGRFMWSEAATDPTDADEPYLVIDGQVRYLWEFEHYSGFQVHAINSDGLVLATELVAGRERVLTTHLDDLSTRTYLDEYELIGDSGLDPTRAMPVALTDGGAVLVQTPVPDTSLMQLWIVDDREVSRLWEADPTLSDRQYDWEHAGYGRLFIDTNTNNMVIGYRGSSISEIQPMFWSPQTGVLELTGLTQVASINDDGTILAKQDDRMVLWRDGIVEWFGGRDSIRDGRFGSALAPAGRAADSTRLVTRITRGEGGSRRTSFLSAKSPFNPITVLERHEYQIAPIAMITESGLVHDGRGGWFDPIDPTDAVTAVGGARAFVWSDRDGVRVQTHSRLNRRLSFSMGSYEDIWSLEDSWIGTRNYFAGDLINDPRSEQFVVFRGPRELDIVGRNRYDSLGAEEIVSRVTGFFRPDGRVVVAGITETGELRLAFEQELIRYDRFQYFNMRYASLTDQLAQRNLPTPAFASNLDSFISPWGAMSIVGLDDAGDLHAVWWSPGLNSPLWTTSNLSDITGAPKLVGTITASATAWNGMQIMGTDERGSLISIWWSPTSGGWQWTNLTAATNGMVLESDSLASATTPWGAIEVIGRTAENELVTYWWAPGSGGWVFESITAQQVGDVPRIAGPLSLVVANDGSQHIAGVSAEGEVIHLYWLPDGSDLWRAENLTALAIR